MKEQLGVSDRVERSRKLKIGEMIKRIVVMKIVLSLVKIILWIAGELCIGAYKILTFTTEPNIRAEGVVRQGDIRERDQEMESAKTATLEMLSNCPSQTIRAIVLRLSLMSQLPILLLRRYDLGRGKSGTTFHSFDRRSTDVRRAVLSNALLSQLTAACFIGDHILGILLTLIWSYAFIGPSRNIPTDWIMLDSCDPLKSVPQKSCPSPCIIS